MPDNRIDDAKKIVEDSTKRDYSGMERRLIAELSAKLRKSEDNSIEAAYEAACQLSGSKKTRVKFAYKGFTYEVYPHRLAAENQRLKDELKEKD